MTDERKCLLHDDDATKKDPDAVPAGFMCGRGTTHGGVVKNSEPELVFGPELPTDFSKTLTTFEVGSHTLTFPPFDFADAPAEYYASTGFIFTPASRILAKYLEQHRERLFVPGARWVELGSGLGLVGMSAAALCSECSVILTDLPDMLPQLKVNLAANHLGNAHMQAYTWGVGPPMSACDVVVASDCIWDAVQIPYFSAALKELTLPGAVALISYQRRCPQVEEALLLELRANFHMDEVKMEDLDLDLKGGEFDGRLAILVCVREERVASS